MLGDNSLIYNIFVYSMNNPVNYNDITGKFFFGIKDIVKKTAKITVDVGTAVVDVTKEAYNYIKNSFTAEAGIGLGAGVSAKVGNLGPEILVKNTMNITYSNGKVSTSTTLGLSAGIFDNGISYEMTHEDHKDNPFHSNPVINPIEISDCEYTTIETSASISKDMKNNSIGSETTSISNNGMFIGLEFEAYLFVGFHIKIGFNI